MFSFLQTGTNLSPFQQILLTLMRLKMNLPLSLLGCMFKISIPTASRTFRSTIEVLNVRLAPALLFWPNREELQLSMPMIFRQVFRKCACIIDCFEIFIERPRNLRARADILKIQTSPYHEISNWHYTTSNSFFYIKMMEWENIRQTLD